MKSASSSGVPQDHSGTWGEEKSRFIADFQGAEQPWPRGALLPQPEAGGSCKPDRMLHARWLWSHGISRICSAGSLHASPLTLLSSLCRGGVGGKMSWLSLDHSQLKFALLNSELSVNAQHSSGESADRMPEHISSVITSRLLSSFPADVSLCTFSSPAATFKHLALTSSGVLAGNEVDGWLGAGVLSTTDCFSIDAGDRLLLAVSSPLAKKFSRSSGNASAEQDYTCHHGVSARFNTHHHKFINLLWDESPQSAHCSLGLSTVWSILLATRNRA